MTSRSSVVQPLVNQQELQQENQVKPNDETIILTEKSDDEKHNLIQAIPESKEGILLSSQEKDTDQVVHQMYPNDKAMFMEVGEGLSIPESQDNAFTAAQTKASTTAEAVFSLLSSDGNIATTFAEYPNMAQNLEVVPPDELDPEPPRIRPPDEPLTRAAVVKVPNADGTYRILILPMGSTEDGHPLLTLPQHLTLRNKDSESGKNTTLPVNLSIPEHQASGERQKRILPVDADGNVYLEGFQPGETSSQQSERVIVIRSETTSQK